MVSAGMVGLSFFMVPTAATAFCRKNLPAGQWGTAVSLFTTVFAVGQIIGPVGAGVVSDTTGGTTTGLALGGGIVLAGALAGAFQRALAMDQSAT